MTNRVHSPQVSFVPAAVPPILISVVFWLLRRG
jgi:hypothetical protein